MSALDIEKADRDLCDWLREHSSGNYRKSSEAADRIEALKAELAAAKRASQPAVAGVDRLTDEQIIELHDSMFPRVPFDRDKIMGNVVRFTRAAIAAHVSGQGGEDAIAVGELIGLLPGVYYMDPPDGGDVSVLEQLRRMSEDAARYRAIRNAEKISGTVWSALEGDDGATLDYAVDCLVAEKTPIPICDNCKAGRIDECMHALPCFLPVAAIAAKESGSGSG